MGSPEPMMLDELDHSILAHLQKDGRKAFREIASDLGVSEGTIRYRYNKLRENNTIRIVGSINPAHVGFKVAASINIKTAPGKLSEVVETLDQLEEVEWMALVTGQFDIAIEVYCRDLAHLTYFLTEQLQKMPGLSESQTVMILRVLKLGQLSLDLAGREASDNELSSLMEEDFWAVRE
jgi:Lrp/AsnC family transcriptional regulator for asnA, asnC and gidA